MLSTSRARHLLLVLGSLAYTALMFVWFSVPAYLGALTADFGLSSTQAGLLTGAIPLTYVPVALFSGAIIDRIGGYRAIGTGLVLFGLAQLGRSLVASTPALFALTVLVGIGGTTITFGLPKLVSDLYPPGSSGTPSSVYVFGSLLGTAAAFSLGRGVIGPLLGGWRPLFRVTGVAVLVYAVVWWATVRWLPVHEIQYRDRDAGGETRRLSFAALRDDVARVFANRPMRLLVVVGVVYLLLLHGIENWLATVLRSRGLAASLAATSVSGFVAAEAVGTLCLPVLSDRLDARGTIIAGSATLCALGVATLLLPGVPLALPVVGALVAGFGVGGISPLVRVIPGELDGIGPELVGTAIGLVFAVGELGGFLGPFLIGSLHDLTGTYAAGLVALCLGCLAAIEAGRRLPV
ncbi:nitrate/nitrite transporter [Halarchaeum acidiphilum MH1-52-1]|uniref:Nitrate/nitrite transporter n=1 Tax=Halarchaeum acidiphilum MH1-52-1 TaxID=1261545 RepID=U2YWG4_9EURY|nr:MFS transporter [Halarchaeum acidiphilum]GAD53142.1 nitrate/nitrite transporter [Halarchaeum acidiphilum MH1-52-1]